MVTASSGGVGAASGSVAHAGTESLSMRTHVPTHPYTPLCVAAGPLKPDVQACTGLQWFRRLRCNALNDAPACPVTVAVRGPKPTTGQSLRFSLSLSLFFAPSLSPSLPLSLCLSLSLSLLLPSGTLSLSLACLLACSQAFGAKGYPLNPCALALRHCPGGLSLSLSLSTR